MGFEPVSLLDSVDTWIKRNEFNPGEMPVDGLTYLDTSQEDGKWGEYTAHYFKDSEGKIYALNGIKSINDQIEAGVNSGAIVKKKSLMRITYIGPVPKKGETEVNEKSFKKYSVQVDNSHFQVEEAPQVETYEEDLPF